jgi:para-nitrobenzyl esterase
MNKFVRRRALMAGAGGGVIFLAKGNSASAGNDDATPVVDTSSGKIRGRRSAGVSRFLGIHYGENTAHCRFQAPQPRAPWVGVKDCSAYGPQAPQGIVGVGPANARPVLTPFARQVVALFSAGMQQGDESEDCLVLNLFTPDASTQRRRPVMVWLHGGGFAIGSGADPQYDGSALCRRGDVVVVTLNHRLTALGYLDLAGLGIDKGFTANAGQLDIILALQWVRENIAAFGGDPDNVTIFGESGGGKKVAVLLAMPAAAGLFHKAIIQSSPVMAVNEPAGATALAERTLAGLGISKADIGKLQTLDAKTIIAAASAAERPGQTLQPALDGTTLPNQPFSPAALGLSAGVPLIIGTNKDEGALFFSAAPDFGSMTPAQAQAHFTAMLGKKGDSAFALYRSLRPEDPPTYWVTALMTDMMMRMDAIRAADSKATTTAPVFMYQLDWNTPVLHGALRCPHGLDVPLVFDNVAAKREILGPGDEPDKLAATMSQAWLNFARSGNPSQAALEWPRYDLAARETMMFDVTSRAVSDPNQRARIFWNA